MAKEVLTATVILLRLSDRIFSITLDQSSSYPDKDSSSIALQPLVADCCQSSSSPSFRFPSSYDSGSGGDHIVSHLGRSNHVAVCNYCGKVYSRKYGLKVHISYIGYKVV